MKKVLRHFYVDDFNSGVKDVSEGVKLYKKLKVRFAEGNFNLRKWRTNNAQLRKYIAEQEQVCDEGDEILNKKYVANINDKILGITWRDEEDLLVIALSDYITKAEEIVVTKRNVLKVIAGFYDPIGFIQPLVVKLKILFQEICKESVAWDDELSDILKFKWYSIIQEMKKNNEVIFIYSY